MHYMSMISYKECTRKPKFQAFNHTEVFASLMTIILICAHNYDALGNALFQLDYLIFV